MDTETQQLESAHDAPAVFHAAPGSANLDMDTMMEVIRRFNERKPPPGPLAVRSDIRKRLNEMPKPKGTIFESALGGIQVYEKPGQLFPAWMIGDSRILEKYLSGEITEADLIGCVGAAGLLPNEKLRHPAGKAEDAQKENNQ